MEFLPAIRMMEKKADEILYKIGFLLYITECSYDDI
jgi:hypothetical protein